MQDPVKKNHPVRRYLFKRANNRPFCELDHSQKWSRRPTLIFATWEAAMTDRSTITKTVHALTVSLFVTCLRTVRRTAGI
jgi:hypothetical protein